MIIKPKIKGFICTTAHPLGCERNVKEQVNYVKKRGMFEGPKNVLVIGASTGFGLASRIAAAFGANASTVGVSYEKTGSERRTASPGWYNTIAFEKIAKNAGLYAASINGDAFSDEIKKQTIELIKKDLGKLDLIIYSIASPRRTDPITGDKYTSVIKPIKELYKNKTIDFLTGEISEVSIEPATKEEIYHTVKVMGGEDWKLWIEALNEADLLSKDAITIAYSYIGPEITFPIYRDGTIGKAKEHLEATAHEISNMMKSKNIRAFISVNKALVTQSSSAIPVVPLYISILYKAMKEEGVHEGCIEQMYRMLKEKLYADNINVDNFSMIRLDDWEMREDIQNKVKRLWTEITEDNKNKYIDIKGYREDFYRLFGFGFDDIDYNQDVPLKY